MSTVAPGTNDHATPSTSRPARNAKRGTLRLHLVVPRGVNRAQSPQQMFHVSR